jgi:hypothetical protein
VQKPLDVSAKPLSDENDKESCKIQWQYDEKKEQLLIKALTLKNGVHLTVTLS